MFGAETPLGARAGEPELPWEEGFDELAHRLTEEEWSRPWPDEGLPSDLDDLPPIMLAALLHRVDPSRLSAFDQIRLLQARERLVSHHQAGSIDAVDAITHHLPPPLENEPLEAINARWEFASDEIRAALRLTRHAAEQRVDLAVALVDDHPRLLEMLRAGRIDLYRVRVVVEGVRHLEVEERRSLVDSILDLIPDLTSGELRALIRRLCTEMDPVRAKRRYENAVRDRRFWLRQTEAGTADIHILDVPIDKARSIGRHVNRFAMSLKVSGDTRTTDQLRTDVACDLLEGGSSGKTSGDGTVELRVDLATLAGLDDRAGEIPGLCPVVADIARQIAERNTDGHWRFTVTDDGGNVIDTGLTRRRFSRAQRRYLEAKYTTCGFPGCRMPASDCDMDHTRPYAQGGPTTTDNGTPECRHDHTLIHEGRWEHHVIDGRHQWISPLGHRYVKTRPP